MEQLEYWKKRCELAEMYIEESPCDPDITMSQLAAYSAWNHFKNLTIPVVSQQSELLKDFVEWYNDDPFGEINAMPYDKAIKEYLKTL